jgi:hypothetical protein
MARIDLHNFFKYYDGNNSNHIKAVQWLENNIPEKFLKDDVEWVNIYRGKVSVGDVCPHCGKSLGK